MRNNESWLIGHRQEWARFGPQCDAAVIGEPLKPKPLSRGECSKERETHFRPLRKTSLPSFEKSRLARVRDRPCGRGLGRGRVTAHIFHSARRGMRTDVRCGEGAGGAHVLGNAERPAAAVRPSDRPTVRPSDGGSRVLHDRRRRRRLRRPRGKNLNQ